MRTNVIDIARKGVFSLEEARQLLPVVKKITHEISTEVEPLLSRLQALPLENKDLIEKLEAELNEQIEVWHLKISKLGAKPKGLWLVDFDSGDGYFCWKHPEPKIMFWHNYKDGFTGRIPLESWITNKHIKENKKTSSTETNLTI